MNKRSNTHIDFLATRFANPALDLLRVSLLGGEKSFLSLITACCLHLQPAS